MAPQSDGLGGAVSPAVDQAASRHERDVLRLFSYLWAAAILFHVGSFDLWDEIPLEVLAAIWVMFAPGSTMAMASLMTLHLSSTLPVT